LNTVNECGLFAHSALLSPRLSIHKASANLFQQVLLPRQIIPGNDILVSKLYDIRTYILYDIRTYILRFFQISWKNSPSGT